MQNQTDEIKNKLDIVDIVSEYIKLTKAGGNHKAPCPFHKEKQPSFMVSQEKQIFHCFGCNEGGDMFSFVQKIENCDFPEALRILAKKAGVEIKQQNPEMYSQKTKVLDVLKQAASFFYITLLENPDAKIAKDYIQKRNIREETVEDFKLGYALDSWDAVYNYLRSKGFSDELIFKSGLISQSPTGHQKYYDRFRRRLMFPIRDIHGQVIGFTGRVLPGGDSEKEGGKYINTPQTLAYNKSTVLYNLDLAKQNIKKAGYIILVEGNMDVVSLYQHGIQNAVCISGTALTEEQVNLLKRFSNNIILAFDMDEGGERALLRGIEQALLHEMNVKVLVLPFGKDPDECVTKDKSAFLTSIKEAKLIMDYFFDKTLKNLDVAQVTDKKQAVKTLLPWIKRIADPVEQTHYIQELSEKININEEVLRDSLNKVKTEKKLVKEKQVKETNVKQTDSNRYEALSNRILALVLINEKKYNFGELIDILEPEILFGDKIKNLYKELIVYYNNNQQLDTDDFIKKHQKNSEIIDLLNILLILGSEENNKFDFEQIKQEIVSYISQLKQQHKRNRIQEIEKEIKQAEEENQTEKIKKLSEEFSKLTRNE